MTSFPLFNLELGVSCSLLSLGMPLKKIIVSDLFSFLVFLSVHGTSVAFTGQGQMIGIERMRDALHFRVATWFLENQKKIKGIASGHSTSIIPNRDSKSKRSNLLFGYFSFIILDSWPMYDSSFDMTVDIFHNHINTT